MSGGSKSVISPLRAPDRKSKPALPVMDEDLTIITKTYDRLVALEDKLT